MAREVSALLDTLTAALQTDYPYCAWREATPTANLENPPANLIGTVAVDDSDPVENGRDRMTGAWYVDLPLVVSLYFSRSLFADYGLARDFAFSVAAWFRRRLVGVPSQGVSQVHTLIKQGTIDQKIDDGVDDDALGDWMLWQIRLTVPEAITPEFPAIPGVFDDGQGPPQVPDVRFDEVFYTENAAEADPNNTTQLVP